jgi:hypothetical protein
MGWSSGGSTFSGNITAAQVTDFDDAVGDLIDVHASDDDESHGAVASTSKVAVITTPAGTAQNIYVAEESSLPSGEFLGDLVFVVADGFF